MAATKPIYDLILLLDLALPRISGARRSSPTPAPRSLPRASCSASSRGARVPLAYEIGHREPAEYHLLQFSGPPSLIAALEHSLRITDGVVRHRVIKLPPGVTVASSATPPPAAPPAPPPPAATSAPAAEPDSQAPAAEPDAQALSAEPEAQAASAEPATSAPAAEPDSQAASAEPDAPAVSS